MCYEKASISTYTCVTAALRDSNISQSVQRRGVGGVHIRKCQLTANLLSSSALPYETS